MEDKQLEEMMNDLSIELELLEVIMKERLERVKPILEKVKSIYSVEVTFEKETETEWHFKLNSWDTFEQNYTVRVIKKTMEVFEDDRIFCVLD